MANVDREGGKRLYNELLRELRCEFPAFRLLKKRDSALQKVLDGALRAITLGAMRQYSTHYQTTLGCRVYVTESWETKDPRERYVILRHERVHMRQFRRYTVVGMAFLYLLIPLPLGAAYFRARFEWQAYRGVHAC